MKTVNEITQDVINSEINPLAGYLSITMMAQLAANALEIIKPMAMQKINESGSNSINRFGYNFTVVGETIKVEKA